MDHITEAFYNVMYQYRLAFTPDGVQANLNQWRQQKTPLLEPPPELAGAGACGCVRSIRAAAA